ncbi:g5 domain protein [Clostridium sp. CAG:508]|jgi:vancomycin resistance protein YoaR|nr:g5 domain protein [Clostridium sp. CAG:508]
MEGQENLDNQEELKKEETPENNVQEEIVENKETEEKKEDNDKTVEEDSMKFKKAEPSKKQKSNKVIPIVVSLFIVLFVMIFSVVFALFNMNNEKILKGISILGIDISDLTVEEAKTKINNAIEERFKDENNNLILKIGENETSVTANTFNAKFDIDNAVIEADNIGRNGNILTNNYSILFTKLFKKEIKPRLYLDDSLLSDTIKDINSKMKDAIVDNSYYIEKNNLIIVKGKAGYIIKTEELKEKIYEQISNIHTNYQTIEIPVEYKEPEPINLQKIHEEIYKEPQDAYVQKNPTVVHPEVNGIDFKISVEEAEELLKEDKEEYTIPLKITKPKKTINNLGEEAFPDLLATFSTRFDGSNYNRNTNIKLAAKKVNGTVILPGEKFSFNTIVGSRTIEAGFKEGTAYVGGKVVPDVGGGVCQVSSTIYNTALLANMQIVERSNHMFTTGYVAASRDATVYYGSLDFVFKNSRKYPIKMVASANGGVCKVSIYGIKEEKEYEVIIQSKITSYINPTTIYKEDPTLEEGKEIVEQTAITGCRSEGYKILKLNGKIVSQTLLSKDTYKSRNKIVRRGTKKTTTTPTKPANENTTNTETSNTTTNEPTTPETTENNTTE